MRSLTSVGARIRPVDGERREREPSQPPAAAGLGGGHRDRMRRSHRTSRRFGDGQARRCAAAVHGRPRRHGGPNPSGKREQGRKRSRRGGLAPSARRCRQAPSRIAGGQWTGPGQGAIAVRCLHSAKPTPDHGRGSERAGRGGLRPSRRRERRQRDHRAVPGATEEESARQGKGSAEQGQGTKS